jgi:NTE family protein
MGGGGARGFAHVGVLQVLDELRLPVRAIAGTSMGAVIGAMYLVHGSAAATLERWREALRDGILPRVRSMQSIPDTEAREHPLIQVARRIRERVVISFAVNRTTVLGDDDLVPALEFLLPDVTVEDLGVPFVAVATDLTTGEELDLGRGALRKVTRASSAIPGVLPAVEIDGRRLVDGAVVAEVPVAAARRLREPVIGIDVSMRLPPLAGDELVLDVLMRTQMMSQNLLRARQLASCLHVLRPDVGTAVWSDWDRLEELAEAGRRAARSFFR